MTNELLLREIHEDDLAILFVQQLDAEANWMAAFTAKEPADREAFISRWRRILADPTIVARAIVHAGQLVGHVLSYEEDGRVEVSYWIGKAYWGCGYATQALDLFLSQVNRTRPIYARVAHDNPASRRVLEKCGFVMIGETTGFANARDAEIAESLWALPAPA
jgi:RimJ/RimL family protein N-acetyltransferase